jgi:hypothetical protein
MECRNFLGMSESQVIQFIFIEKDAGKRGKNSVIPNMDDLSLLCHLTSEITSYVLPVSKEYKIFFKLTRFIKNI